MPSTKTAGLRVPEDKFSDVKTFFQREKKQIVKSMEWMESDEFFLLPIDIYRKAIELIPDSRLDLIVDDMINLHSRWTSVYEIITALTSWCSYCNAKQKSKFYSCTKSVVNENIELTWVHHFGIKNRNYSHIMFEAFSNNPNYSAEYDIKARDLGIHSLTVQFTKL
jgi:hypothetical protein